MSDVRYILKPSFDYLSGDLNKRLLKLIEAEEIDPSYSTEIAAIKNVQPLPVPLSQIIIKIGATWIPTEFYEEFCLEVFEVDLEIFYCAYNHVWDFRLNKVYGMSNYDWGWNYDPVNSHANQYFHGVKGFEAIGTNMTNGLFTLALNQSSPVVKSKINEDSEWEKDPDFTRQAIAKQNQIKRAFDSWCREDQERAEYLEYLYNTEINTTVLADWDGKGIHLREGLLATYISQEWLNKLRNYQLDTIWRFAIRGGINALEVGLGKTPVACAVVMLRKHYKSCTKAMIVVQASTLNQIYYTFREMFPKSRILCAPPEDMSIKNLQRTLAKIAYSEWDAVIMTHNSFESIPVKEETEASYLIKELSVIKKEIEILESYGERRIKQDGRNGRRGNDILKSLGTTKDNLEQELYELDYVKKGGIFWDKRKPLDAWELPTIYWEDLGVDFLVVDEVQNFKNKSVPSRLSHHVPGLTVSQSNRSKDFDLKTRWLIEKYSNNAIMGMTGTPPPTNSLIEIYIYQTFFQPEELRNRHIYNLDAWIANFGDIKPRPEAKNDGKWRMTERLTDFVNVAELARMWFSVVHYKRYDQIKRDFTQVDRRPEPIHIKDISKMSKFQTEYMVKVSDRYQRMKTGDPYLFPCRDREGNLLDENRKPVIHPTTKKPIKKLSTAIAFKLDISYITDNHLLLSTDTRNLMIAPQLHEPRIPVEKGSKLHNLAENVLGIYKETAEERLTQVVFLDIGTPGGSAKFCLYDWLAQHWIKNGVADTDIEFIQNHNNANKKEKLFHAINSGKVRILITSTSAGGIGVNIQDKLYAVHHANFPLRPDEMEQREGRAIRQGNFNSRVRIYRYITEGSNGKHGADTVLLQFLESKQKARDRFFNGDPTLRRMNESEDAAQLYMILKAESTGDSRIVRYTEVDVELEEKQSELALVLSEVNRVNGSKGGSVTNSERIIAAFKKEIKECLVDIDVVAPFEDIGVEQSEVISYCFRDGLLVIGCSQVQKNEIFLDKPEWMSELLSLYKHKKFELMPLKKAKVYIKTRLKNEIVGYDYEAKSPKGSITYGRRSTIECVGCYKGLAVYIAAMGNNSYQFWLQGNKEWRIIFRRSGDLLLEQLEKGISNILESVNAANKNIDSQEARMKKLLERKDYLENKAKEVKKLVSDLDKEKSELQHVLNIVE